jgi:hypothetical protein
MDDSGMKTVDVDELIDDGYREDPRGRRRFEGPHNVVGLALSLVILGSIFLLATGRVSPWLGFSLIGAGMLAAVVLQVAKSSSPPVSRHTGKPYLEYLSSRRQRGYRRDTIYVCPGSKTYFVVYGGVEGQGEGP